MGGEVLLVDPWLAGNPMFEASRRAEATGGATHVLVSHGHGDHATDAPGIAAELGIPVAGTYELVGHWAQKHGITAVGFNTGGTVRFGGVAVTMVNAAHSSSFSGENGPVYAGTEAGFMIEGEGRTIYFSGDTDVMADMEVFQDLHHPEIGILACGGHFTMDMKRAAYAARKFFDFRTVIPCHYRTFPLLAQSADELKSALPGVTVIEPEVLVPFEL
jgi:L-ascorbate metabolism protein UlaG (beta-lactamase superfamily)